MKYLIFFALLLVASPVWAGECALVTLTGTGSDAAPFRPQFPPGIEKTPGFKWTAQIPSKADGTPQYPDAYVCFPDGYKFPPGLAALPPGQAAAGILKRDPTASLQHMMNLPPAAPIKGSLRDLGERAYRIARYYLGVAVAWAVTATDSFTGTGPLSGNWSGGYTGESTPSVVSNAAECADGQRCVASYNAFVPGADQYAQGVVTQYRTDLDGDVGVGVRIADPPTFTGFFARAGRFLAGGPGSTALQKRINGVNTALSSDTGYPIWNFGDTIRIEVSGTGLIVKRNNTPILTGTDPGSPFLTSGRGGMMLNSLNSAGPSSRGRLDDFEIGGLVSLADGLIAYWELEEASGTRVDAHGGNNLTDNGSVANATGKVGNAADFSGSNSLSRADNAALSAGTGSFTFAAWVKLDSKPARRMAIIAKLGSNDLEYDLRWRNDDDRFEARISSGAGFANTAGMEATSAGAPTIGTWYFIVFWYDAIAHTWNIQVDNGAIDNISYPLSSYDSGAPFEIGTVSAFPGNELDAKVDQVGFWKRVLTTQEKSSLYNGSAGLSYASLIGGGGGAVARRNRIIITP